MHWNSRFCTGRPQSLFPGGANLAQDHGVKPCLRKLAARPGGPVANVTRNRAAASSDTRWESGALRQR
eukprot:6488608-Heterocapsa_arctica.AAC.1